MIIVDNVRSKIASLHLQRTPMNTDIVSDVVVYFAVIDVEPPIISLVSIHR